MGKKKVKTKKKGTFRHRKQPEKRKNRQGPHSQKKKKKTWIKGEEEENV